MSGNMPMGVGLRLIATSDLHAHVMAHDYHADGPLRSGGLDRTAVLIEDARAEARAQGRASILLDCGDFLSGTPLADWAAEARAASVGALEVEGAGAGSPTPPPPEVEADPVIAAMNRLGYDAAALGNHELDEPPAALAAALGQARFPVLCATAPRRSHPASTIVEREVVGDGGARHVLRVGVLGVLPPQVVPGPSRRAHGWRSDVDAPGAVETVRREAARLRAAGAHLVVALVHAGFGEADGEAEPCDDARGSGGASSCGPACGSALAVASRCDVDAVICGHTHQLFPSPGPGTAPRPGVDSALGRLAGVPAVMPGWRGSHLGVIDLDLARAADGWRAIGARSTLRAVAELAPDATAGLAAMPAVMRGHRAAGLRQGRVLGRSLVPLSTAFAHVGASSALDLMAEAQTLEARALLRGGPHGGLPLLCAVSPVHCGGRRGAERFTEIPAGPILGRHVDELHHHGDALVVLQVTGAGLRDWLERAAVRFAGLALGARDAALLDDAVPAYEFDVIYGLRYALDVSRAPRFDPSGLPSDGGGGRVARLEHDGRPVRDGDVFAVAAKSHRVAGQGLYASLARCDVIARSPVSLREALRRHVAARGPLRPSPGPRWGLVGAPGATALLRAPAAAEVPRGGLVPCGRVSRVDGREDGPVATYRLHL